MSQPSTAPGDDDPHAWNDRHFQHCYLWLTCNPASPYCGSPAMLLTALGVDKAYWGAFRKALGRGDLARYRFSVRLSLTKSFGRVLAGNYDAQVVARDKNGRIVKYAIKPAVNPQPLPCPAFYRASIKMTSKGLALALRRTDANLAPRFDPEGMSRLTNAFGKR